MGARRGPVAGRFRLSEALDRVIAGSGRANLDLFAGGRLFLELPETFRSINVSSEANFLGDRKQPIGSDYGSP